MTLDLPPAILTRPTLVLPGHRPAAGAELVPGGPGPGPVRAQRAAGEVLPRGAGQGGGAEGAGPGVPRRGDGARGARRGAEGAHRGHRPEGPAAPGVLPGPTGRTRQTYPRLGRGDSLNFNHVFDLLLQTISKLIHSSCNNT